MADNLLKYMNVAIEQAESAYQAQEVPVGAVIVHPDKGIIAQAHNLVETTKNSLAHAEMIAIYNACERIGHKWLIDCDLYTTLEPCHLCAAAISTVRLKNLFFGAYDFKTGAVEHGACIFEHMHFKPNVFGGIAEKKCSELLKLFFQKKR